tara:strand:- start:1747 stop:2676 length:930 start_codon:yes stop_codon:yes gene_type:complete
MRFIFCIIIIFNFFINYHAFSKEIYVIMKVNDQIITNVDINNEYRYLIALSPTLQNIDKKKVINLAKDSIIREKIKKNEIVKHFNLEVENKFIEKIIKNFYKKMGIENKEDFKKYLLQYNLDYNDIKEKFTIEAAWNDLIYKKFSSRIEINEEKIKKKINKIISESKEQNIYNLSEILFTVENYNELQTKYKLINKSIEEIGFNNTASIHSISDSAKLGGKVGWVNESQLNETIIKEIKNLTINNYTDPITIPGGFLIVKLDDKKKEKTNINFNEEFNRQVSLETNSQFDQFSEIYFKKIKKNSVISEK